MLSVLRPGAGNLLDFGGLGVHFKSEETRPARLSCLQYGGGPVPKTL